MGICTTMCDMFMHQSLKSVKTGDEKGQKIGRFSGLVMKILKSGDTRLGQMKKKQFGTPAPVQNK